MAFGCTLKKNEGFCIFLCLLPITKVFILKNNIDLKSFVMKKKGIKRINLWVEDALYSQIKKQADDAFLKVSTYTRQLIQQAIKNNSIKN